MLGSIGKDTVIAAGQEIIAAETKTVDDLDSKVIPTAAGAANDLVQGTVQLISGVVDSKVQAIDDMLTKHIDRLEALMYGTKVVNTTTLERKS